MMFTKRLREGVRNGEITCSVRIWTKPHVRVGGLYPMEEGQIKVDSIEPIGFPDITPEFARASGFLGVLDLLKVAKHGRGEKIYLVRFHYLEPKTKRGRAPIPLPPAAKRGASRASERPRSSRHTQRQSGGMPQR